MFTKDNKSVSIRLALVLAFVVGILRAAPVRALEDQSLLFPDATGYVATTGNDTNDCATPSTPCATINGAIAKAATSGDTIKVAIGTYTGSGDQVVLITKSITLSGGWDPTFTTQSGASTIDGQGTRGGVTLAGSVVGVIEYFTIQNASFCFIGGISVWEATLTLNNSAVINNNQGTCTGGGGGIDNYGTVTLNNSIVSGNTGGIQNYGILTLNNSKVSDNYCQCGGAGIGNDHIAVLNNSTVSGNRTNNSGGGIYNQGTLSLNNSMVYGNSAFNNHGGGINSAYGSLTLNNSTVSNNSATLSGGGIYAAGDVSITNSILSNNSSEAGPDCSGSVTSNGNNIISDTTGCNISAANGDKFNINPMLGTFLPIQGYQPLLLGSPAINSGNSVTCLPTDQRGVARTGTCDMGAYEYTTPGTPIRLTVFSGNKQRTPPSFAFAQPLRAVAVDSQGSPVPNVHVTFTAPASGAGGIFADTATNTTSALTDVGGVATTSVFIANNQFGTYNVSASAAGISAANFNLMNAGWYVSTSGHDSNSCSLPTSPCQTINGAIGKAMAGHTIVVASGVYTGTNRYVVTVSKDLFLSGGWNSSFTAQTSASTIDGQNARAGVLVWAPFPVTVAMERFAIIQSSANGTDGGGINNQGILTLTNVTLTKNVAFSGGGIYNDGTLRLNNTTLSDNYAGIGGGIYNSQGIVSITNTLISGNRTIAEGADCFGLINASEYSLIGDVADCEVTNGPGNLLNVNPQLGSFNTAGGYYPLLLSSPAIDAGDDHTCALTDQRGVSRPQGESCDIGAYEASVSFTDVPTDFWAWSFVERLYSAGITGGCNVNPLQYCAEGTVTRAQMAVFIERGVHGSSFAPPALGGSTSFGDVPLNHWAGAWIKQLAAEGITGGCGSGNYCPEAPVTRAQMAVFLLKAKYGTSYTPPAVGASTGFSDVQPGYWAAAWIKQLAAEGITGGCGTGTYCPEAPVTRAQMAVFLVRTFNLP